jgi:hypothetical protein
MEWLKVEIQWVSPPLNLLFSDSIWPNNMTTIVTWQPGRAIAQAVSRRLPTAPARVQTRVWSSGICGGQNGAGAGFLRVLRFPLPIFILPTSPFLHHHNHQGQVQQAIQWPTCRVDPFRLHTPVCEFKKSMKTCNVYIRALHGKIIIS